MSRCRVISTFVCAGARGGGSGGPARGQQQPQAAAATGRPARSKPSCPNASYSPGGACSMVGGARLRAGRAGHTINAFLECGAVLGGIAHGALVCATQGVDALGGVGACLAGQALLHARAGSVGVQGASGALGAGGRIAGAGASPRRVAAQRAEHNLGPCWRCAPFRHRLLTVACRKVKGPKVVQAERHREVSGGSIGCKDPTLPQEATGLTPRTLCPCPCSPSCLACSACQAAQLQQLHLTCRDFLAHIVLGGGIARAELAIGAVFAHVILLILARSTAQAEGWMGG